MCRKTGLLMLVAVLLLAGLLSIPACTSNPEGTELPSPEQAEEGENIEVLPPLLDETEKGNPKLSGHLNRLIEAERQGEAESFARQRNIELVDGKVRVVIECLPGQVEAAAEAATKAGAKLEPSYKNWLPALVPITSLTALAEAESIRLIRLPIRSEEEAE